MGSRALAEGWFHPPAAPPDRSCLHVPAPDRTAGPQAARVFCAVPLRPQPCPSRPRPPTRHTSVPLAVLAPRILLQTWCPCSTQRPGPPPRAQGEARLSPLAAQGQGWDPPHQERMSRQSPVESGTGSLDTGWFGMVRRSPSQGYFMMTGFTARHLGTADPRNLLLVLLLLSGNSHHDRAQ